MNKRTTLAAVVAAVTILLMVGAQIALVTPSGAQPLLYPTFTQPPVNPTVTEPPPMQEDEWLVATLFAENVGDNDDPKTWSYDYEDLDVCLECYLPSWEWGCTVVDDQVCLDAFAEEGVDYILWDVLGTYYYNYPETEYVEYHDSNFVWSKPNGTDGKYWIVPEEDEDIIQSVYHNAYCGDFTCNGKISHWPMYSTQMNNMHFRHGSSSGCWHDTLVRLRWATVNPELE